MKIKGTPKADLPFDHEFVSYARTRLVALNIEPKAKWLRGGTSTLLDLLTLGDDRAALAEARKRKPETNEDWETVRFLEAAMLSALRDMRFGYLRDFRQFEALYRELLGDDFRPWFPMLYLGALASLALGPERRRELLDGFDPDRLLVEEEVAVRGDEAED